MYPNEVRDYFKTWAKASRELGISNNTYQGWLKNGSIPIKMQYLIEAQCRGYLKADPLHDIELQKNIGDRAKERSRELMDDLFKVKQYLLNYSSDNKTKSLDSDINAEILFNECRHEFAEHIKAVSQFRQKLFEDSKEDIYSVISGLIKNKVIK